MARLRPPTDLEREQLAHLYDPIQAHLYYLKTRELKGRQKAKPKVTGGWNKDHTDWTGTKVDRSKKVATYEDGSKEPLNVYRQKQRAINNGGVDPRTGKTVEEIHKQAVARQKKAITEQINNLSDKLKKLEALIRKKEHEEASTDRKSEAKKERASKEKDKPDSAAEKAEAARQNEKYREKNQQKLKNKSNDSKSGGGDSKSPKDSKSSGPSVSELRSLATKVKGRIAVAKQKLAAL